MPCQRTGRQIKTTAAKPGTLMEAVATHMMEDEKGHSQTVLCPSHLQTTL